MSACSDKRLRDMIGPWELGMLTEDERREFELHLMECEPCYAAVKELESDAALLARDGEVREIVSAADVSVGREVVPDRSRMWSVLRPVLAVAAVLAILLLRPWRIEFSPSDVAVAEANRLVVMYFENLSGKQDSLQTERLVANLIMTELAESSGLQVVSSERLGDLLELQQQAGGVVSDDASALKIAEAAEARWMLTGSILQVSPKLEITYRLVDTESGEIAGSDRVSGDADGDIFSVVDELALRVKRDLPISFEAGTDSGRSVADMTTNSSMAYHHYLNGVESYTRLYFDESRASLMKALELDSTFAMAWYYMSYVGDRSHIARAVKYSGDAGVIDRLYILARASLLDGDFDGYRCHLLEITEIAPDEKRPWYLLGSLESGRGSADSARVYFSRALEIAPNYREAYNNLAYVYMELGERDSALWAAENYVNLAPDEANPYDTRGDVYLYLNQIDSAIVSFHKAVLRKPDFYSTRVKLANLYLEKRRYDDAERLYRERTVEGDIIEVKSAAADLATMWIYKGRIGEALGELDAGLARPMGDSVNSTVASRQANLLYSRSLIFEELGDFGGALKAVVEARSTIYRVRPGDSVSYRPTYVRLLAGSGQIGEARSDLAEFWQYLDRIQYNRFYAHLAEGYIAMAEQQWEVATGHLLSAVEEAPESDRFRPRFALGRCYLESGQYSDAIELFESVLSAYSADRIGHPIWNNRVHYLLGLAYEETGETDKAVERYERYVSYWKDADFEMQFVGDASSRIARLRNQL